MHAPKERRHGVDIDTWAPVGMQKSGVRSLSDPLSHYDERLAADKAVIRSRVVEVGRRVDQAIASAVEALLERDKRRCYAIVLGDLPINREVRAISALCHAFVARHLPSAGHLRFVSSVLQVNIALERIGDYAVTIAREAVQLYTLPSKAILDDVEDLGSDARTILRQAVKAFGDEDAELARQAKPLTKEVERRYARMFRLLTREAVDLPIADAFGLLMIFSRLERVSDQSKNLCEETLFALTGETKPPKRYQILFVDATDTLIAPLAVALARRAFPESGDYESAGFQPGSHHAPELESLAAEFGLDLSETEPSPFKTSREALERYHVVVCLTQEAARQIPEVPYTTVLLEWELPRLSDPNVGSTVEARLREIKHRLSAEIRNLMVTLRGEEAE